MSDFHGCHGCGGRHHVNKCVLPVRNRCRALGPFAAIDRDCIIPPACDFQTMTFINPTSIVIPAQGQATPYPSPIIVSGMTGNIIKVTVRLINLSHTFPKDIDIMLVGPGGQNATIMSDVGGSAAVTNVNLTLDDLAPSAMSDIIPLVSGTFKPTNAGIDVPDPFPGAPPPSGGSMLSSFNFTNPNGTWNLFVIDDLGGLSVVVSLVDGS